MNTSFISVFCWKFLVLCFILGGAVLSVGSVRSDCAFLNGKVWTVNPEQPWAEAVVVVGDRIVFVGSDEDAKVWIDQSSRVIDLKGRLMLPGFNDAHVHFSDGGFSIIALRLRSAEYREAFRDRIKTYVQDLPPGSWITGGNWDHEAWPDKQYPDRWLVDPVTADYPILINRLDGHVALANSPALQIAGITRDTPDPEGGFIERNADGEPTGILKDNAMGLVSRHIPSPPDSVRMNAIQAALDHSAELGITSVQDMSPAADFHLYQKLLQENGLTCRINAVMPIETYTKVLSDLGVKTRFGDAMLRIGSLKCFADGSMGAGSALFFEPYSDDPTTAGLGIFSKEALVKQIVDAHAIGSQVMTHAIGDKANRWVLDAYEEAIKQHGVKGLRHRIEHAQVVDCKDLSRFAELGVLASIQPSHCIDDMRWAEKRIGKARCANAYMYKSFYDACARVAFGTDWPVEPLDPMLGIYAAVTRESPDGGPDGGWFPEQIISMETAIQSYTLDAAYAEHEETVKGSIESGKLADLIVLDQNIFEIPPKEILQTQVDLTMMGGRFVFER